MSQVDVTAILRQWSDVVAQRRLHWRLRHERPNHTFHSAERVHEASSGWWV